MHGHRLLICYVQHISILPVNLQLTSLSKIMLHLTVQNAKYDGHTRTKLELSETSSPLYNVLCAPDQTGACTYPGFVELDANLDYSAPSAQAGSEYQVDTVRVIRVHSSDGSAWYYEYSHVPCVGFEYLMPGTSKKVFNGVVTEKRQSSGGQFASSLCAEKSRAIARESCCDAGTNKLSKTYEGCVYYSERVKYATGVDRCAAAGEFASSFHFRSFWSVGPHTHPPSQTNYV